MVFFIFVLFDPRDSAEGPLKTRTWHSSNFVDDSPIDHA